MRSGPIAALLVAAILAGAAAGYFVGSANQRTTTTTKATTLLSTSTVTTIYEDEGALLHLQVRLNASNMNSGGAIFAEVSLFNPFGMNLSVIPSYPPNPTIASWNGYDYVCGGGVFSTMLGYALLEGHYDSSNLSSAGNPLRLAPPVALPCAVFLPPALTIFLPHGNETWDYYPQSPARGPSSAVINASTKVSNTNAHGGTECGGGNSLYGYWDEGQIISCEAATTDSTLFHYFSPGQYTLAAEDAWGHQAFAYFAVT